MIAAAEPRIVSPSTPAAAQPRIVSPSTPAAAQPRILSPSTPAAAQPRIVSPPTAALLLALAACAHAPASPRGLSKHDAIEVCLTPGVKRALDGWRCPGGDRPRQVRRLGSIGTRTDPVDPNDPRLLLQMDPEVPIRPGEPDFHIVEAFEMRCADLAYTIFIDMYHCAPPPKR